jgi:ribosome-associated protein
MDFNTDLAPELFFKTSRSSGKGGQNVNKVSTKVELNFDVAGSALLTPEQKQRIMERLPNRINKENILQVVVQSERSQFRNKELAIEKFKQLIASCFVEKKKRIKSKLPRSVKEKRLNDKKKRGEKKKLRGERF